MPKRVTILVATLALVMLVGITGCSVTQETVGQVNGEKITKKEFDQSLYQMQRRWEQQSGMTFEGEAGQQMLDSLKEMVLEQLIAEKLLLQEAKEDGLKVKSEEVSARLAQDKQMVGNNDEFKKILQEELNLTEREYKKYLEDQLLLEKLYNQVVADVKVDETEVKNYYDQNQGTFVVPEQWHVKHILVNTEEEANQVIKDLKGGADFAQLAVDKSIDPSAPDNKGDLGFIDETTNFVEEFKTAAFALEVGQLSSPVKSDYGYHVIKLEERQPARQQTYEEAKFQIESWMTQQKQSEKFQLFMEDLKNKATIVKNTEAQPSQPAQPAPAETPPAETPPAETPPAETPPAEQPQK